MIGHSYITLPPCDCKACYVVLQKKAKWRFLRKLAMKLGRKLLRKVVVCLVLMTGIVRGMHIHSTSDYSKDSI